MSLIQDNRSALHECLVGAGSLGDQLRKDNIDWEEFLKVYRSIAEGVSTYLRGTVSPVP